MKKLFLVLSMLMMAFPVFSVSWKISGKDAIEWRVDQSELPIDDHIEMSGFGMSSVLHWKIRESGSMEMKRSLIFPMLRMLPDVTQASFRCFTALDVPSLLSIDGMILQDEIVQEVRIDGMFNYSSTFSLAVDYRGPKDLKPGTVAMNVSCTPSTSKSAYVEHYEFVNLTRNSLTIVVPEYCQRTEYPAEQGKEGAYVLETRIAGSGARVVKKGESVEFYVVFSAFKATEKSSVEDPSSEIAARKAFVKNDIDSKLVLESPDSVVDMMFRFAKIRTAESIFKTKRGLMHSPGGTSFYAALWCNDEGEYTAPAFPFLGYQPGNEASENCFRLYGEYMGPDYEAIPSSIISQGDSTWCGAGDRGDAAMLAYGAARYLLAKGDRQVAGKVMPIVEWCLEYCHRQLNADGVVASDSDELENRFPSGDANLCTSCLYYDALLSAAYLNDALGQSHRKSSVWRKRAAELASNIEVYFGRNVQGYETYRYYAGNDILRSWICIPLTVGIMNRAEQTIKALFSPLLWSPQGCLSAQGSSIYWDRTTLYGLRGAYCAGAVEEATEKLHFYSNLRLLGDHVPYAIEAWPEGGQAHLSGESALYCRVITEGLFGIRPTGFRSFEFTPRLPGEWPEMALRHIQAFGSDFDIEISRTKPGQVAVKVTEKGSVVLSKTVKDGTKLTVRLK